MPCFQKTMVFCGLHAVCQAVASSMIRLDDCSIHVKAKPRDSGGQNRAKSLYLQLEYEDLWD